jgi:hypothetical protein
LDLSFGGKAVGLTGCGQLVPDGHSYTITKKPNQLLVTMNAEPRSIVLAMGNDGKLSGPGTADVKGRIITGYRKVWMQQYINGVAQVGGNCAGSCGYWAQEPIYAPKTERCRIGTFAQRPPPKPEKNDLAAGIVSALVTPVGPAGLRMSGHYLSQGGLALEFAADAVILDCGAAHVKQSYTVENLPNQILITVKNGASPFTVALQANGTLTGSGTAEVAGRVVTGSTDDALTYAPKNARCAIGTLAPKGNPTTAQISQ